MKKLIILLSFLLLSCSNDNKLNLKEKLNKKPNTENNIKNQASNINKNNILKIESINEPVKHLNLNIDKQNLESSTIKDKKLIDISMIPTIFSFKYEQKENKHSLALISTLDNLYLKNFINNINKIKDTNIYILILSENNNIFNKIWCSEKREIALESYLKNQKIINENMNCNKDGINYVNGYIKNYFSDKNFPIVIFDDGNYVTNAYNATPELINLYNEERN